MDHIHMRRHAETAKRASIWIVSVPKMDVRGVPQVPTLCRVQRDARNARLGTCPRTALRNAQYAKQADMPQRSHPWYVQHALQVLSVLREPMHEITMWDSFVFFPL
jgi:hypothetical protein